MNAASKILAGLADARRIIAGERVPGTRVHFYLPYPPPLSACYRNHPRYGRVKTGVYKAWETQAGFQLKAAGVLPLTGEVKALYEFGRPDKRRRDLGNLEKSVSDCLVKFGVIEDDSHIIDLRLCWMNQPGCRVTLEAA